MTELPDSQIALEIHRRFRAFLDEGGRDLSFAEQAAAIEHIFARWPQELGPEIIWRPGPDELEHSNPARFMASLDLKDFSELHAWSVANRADLWGRLIERLGVCFTTTPREILGGSDEHPTWLDGGELNISDSCFQAPADSLAVVCGRQGSDELRRVSSGELEALVNRITNGLAEHGFTAEDRIALYMPMTLECVAAYLAIVRSGAAVVSVADSFSASELGRRLAIAEASAVITVDSFARGTKSIDMYSKVRAADAPRTVVIAATGEVADLRRGDLLWAELLSDETTASSRPSAPSGLTNILFSSGTTGTPKTIPWTHLTPIKCAADGHLHHDIRAGDVVAWPTNIGWMMGPWLIYASLINGAAMALYEGAPTGPGFTDFVHRAGVTMLGVVPSLVRAWRMTPDADHVTWPTIRAYSSTGEPSSREDYLWLMARSGYDAPVIEYCGGTEIGGGYVTGSVVQPASPATFTTPAVGLDLVLLDADGQAVPDGELGEVFLLPPSIGLSERLLNRDHHEVYHDGCPPGPDGAVLRRHGDQMSRLPGGFYRARGRADDTMNLGGIKVSSLEIEQAVENHPAIHEAAAVAVQPGGEGAEQLVLFVVLEPEATVPLEIGHFRDELNRVIAA